MRVVVRVQDPSTKWNHNGAHVGPPSEKYRRHLGRAWVSIRGLRSAASVWCAALQSIPGVRVPAWPVAPDAHRLCSGMTGRGDA